MDQVCFLYLTIVIRALHPNNLGTDAFLEQLRHSSLLDSNVKDRKCLYSFRMNTFLSEPLLASTAFRTHMDKHLSRGCTQISVVIFSKLYYSDFLEIFADTVLTEYIEQSMDLSVIEKAYDALLQIPFFLVSPTKFITPGTNCILMDKNYSVIPSYHPIPNNSQVHVRFLSHSFSAMLFADSQSRVQLCLSKPPVRVDADTDTDTNTNTNTDVDVDVDVDPGRQIVADDNILPAGSNVTHRNGPDTYEYTSRISLKETLLRHPYDLWDLWEMAVIGESLVIIADTPRKCCQAVLGIMDLLGPIPYSGIYQPYLASHTGFPSEFNSEHYHPKMYKPWVFFNSFADHEKPSPHKHFLPSNGHIVATTNPYLISNLKPRNCFWINKKENRLSQYRQRHLPRSHTLIAEIIRSQKCLPTDSLSTAIETKVRDYFEDLGRKLLSPMYTFLRLITAPQIQDAYNGVPNRSTQTKKIDKNELKLFIKNGHKIIKSKPGLCLYTAYIESRSFSKWIYYEHKNLQENLDEQTDIGNT